MAANITFKYEDPTTFVAGCTTTADSDASTPIALTNGFLQGGAQSQRSAADAYAVLVQYSINGTAWVTLGALTDVAPQVDFTASKVSQARYIRFFSTTNGAQTITMTMRLAR